MAWEIFKYLNKNEQRAHFPFFLTKYGVLFLVIKISVHDHKNLKKKKDNEIKRASRSIYQKTNGGAWEK
jgi:hypothetical protein